jgi:hypothetical protein
MEVQAMSNLTMPRKQINFKIDDRLIPAFKEAAQDAGMSINGYLETLLTGHLKHLGKLPMDVTPLPETRGGKREGTGRKPKDDAPETDRPSDEA